MNCLSPTALCFIAILLVAADNPPAPEKQLEEVIVKALDASGVWPKDFDGKGKKDADKIMEKLWERAPIINAIKPGSAGRLNNGGEVESIIDKNSAVIQLLNTNTRVVISGVDTSAMVDGARLQFPFIFQAKGPIKLGTRTYMELIPHKLTAAQVDAINTRRIAAQKK